MINQQWLTILIVILIVVIIVDGIRRMRKAKKDSIKMSLKKHFDDSDDDVIYGSEFPNGGARASNAEIDKERIMKARSKYNFGDDLPNWKQTKAKSGEKSDADTTETPEPAAVPRDETKPCDDIQPPAEAKIEPSISSSDHDLDLSPDAESEPAIEVEEVAEAKIAKPAVTTQQQDEPVQTSLNLDDDVPMLMEKVDSHADEKSDSSSVTSSSATTEATEMPIEQKPEEAGVIEKPIQSIASKIEPSISDIDTHSANKPRYESKYTNHADIQGQIPTDVIVINLRARENDFLGSDLLPLILDNGLRFGAMDIFHFHAEEDGEGDVLFSMANIVKPGTFDLASFETFETVGLSFFLTLPVSACSHMQAFDQMVDVTKAMAKALQCELLDENRSVLTGQTIEHYRERVRDFSRREQLEKNK